MKSPNAPYAISCAELPYSVTTSFNNASALGVIDRATGLVYIGEYPSARPFIGVWLSGSDMKTVDSIWLADDFGPPGAMTTAIYEFDRIGMYPPLYRTVARSQANFTVTIQPSH